MDEQRLHDCERLLIALHRKARDPVTARVLKQYAGGGWPEPERFAAAITRLVELGIVRLSRRANPCRVTDGDWRYAANGGPPIDDPWREEWLRTTKTARLASRGRQPGGREDTA